MAKKIVAILENHFQNGQIPDAELAAKRLYFCMKNKKEAKKDE